MQKGPVGIGLTSEIGLIDEWISHVHNIPCYHILHKSKQHQSCTMYHHNEIIKRVLHITNTQFEKEKYVNIHLSHICA